MYRDFTLKATDCTRDYFTRHSKDLLSSIASIALPFVQLEYHYPQNPQELEEESKEPTSSTQLITDKLSQLEESIKSRSRATSIELQNIQSLLYEQSEFAKKIQGMNLASHKDFVEELEA